MSTKSIVDFIERRYSCKQEVTDLRKAVTENILSLSENKQAELRRYVNGLNNAELSKIISGDLLGLFINSFFNIDLEFSSLFGEMLPEPLCHHTNVYTSLVGLSKGEDYPSIILKMIKGENEEVKDKINTLVQNGKVNFKEKFGERLKYKLIENPMYSDEGNEDRWISSPDGTFYDYFFENRIKNLKEDVEKILPPLALKCTFANYLIWESEIQKEYLSDFIENEDGDSKFDKNVERLIIKEYQRYLDYKTSNISKLLGLK